MVNLKEKDVSKLLIAAIFVMIGVLTRTIFHIAPNIEFITSISLLSGYYLSGKYKFTVPFLTMVITDTIIGNTNVLIFTWSAFLLGGYFGQALKTNPFFDKALGTIKSKPGFDFVKRLGTLEAGGIAFTLFFYLWTNFGVWFLGTMYPKTAAGLMASYINAIPFLRPQLMGNIIIVPMMVVFTEFALRYLNLKGPAFLSLSYHVQKSESAEKSKE